MIQIHLKQQRLFLLSVGSKSLVYLFFVFEEKPSSSLLLLNCCAIVRCAIVRCSFAKLTLLRFRHTKNFNFIFLVKIESVLKWLWQLGNYGGGNLETRTVREPFRLLLAPQYRWAPGNGYEYPSSSLTSSRPAWSGLRVGSPLSASLTMKTFVDSESSVANSMMVQYSPHRCSISAWSASLTIKTQWDLSGELRFDNGHMPSSSLVGLKRTLSQSTSIRLTNHDDVRWLEVDWRRYTPLLDPGAARPFLQFSTVSRKQ